MPPKGKLSAEAIAALTAWIQQGAPWPSTEAELRMVSDSREFKITPKDRAFWSFQPVADPVPPPITADRSGHAAQPQSSVDHFVWAKLQASGLISAASADKRTLIRRATFDLIGLPPTPEEIDAFLQDDSADAFAKVVDRLLASPHYGDALGPALARRGPLRRGPSPHVRAPSTPTATAIADWLIRAFNADIPYDRFIKEQLAADLLGEPGRRERLPALGFFALGRSTTWGSQKTGSAGRPHRHLTRGFLGLTVACARCHDHKFDPIPTKDYYVLAGVFASTEYEEVPLVPQTVVEEAKAQAYRCREEEKWSAHLPFRARPQGWAAPREHESAHPWQPANAGR